MSKITELSKFRETAFAAIILAKADPQEWKFHFAIIAENACVAEFVSLPTRNKLFNISAEQDSSGIIHIISEVEKNNYEA